MGMRSSNGVLESLLRAVMLRKLGLTQGHPTEYFDKISVRMESCLKISNFFAPRLFEFFGRP